MKLTDNEIAMLTICLNYDNRETQLSDNYTRGTVGHAHALMGSKEAGAGLIGSLVKKGLVLDPSVHGTDPNDAFMGYKPWGPEENMVWMTDEGVNAIFDHIDSKKEEGA